MKRLLSILIVFLLLAFAVPSYAVTLTLAWSQEIPVENDLSGWRLYQSSTAGTGYAKVKEIAFTAPLAEYQTTFDVLPITGPIGSINTFFFVLTSVDTSQNESAYSNEVTFTIQDVIAPKSPFIIRIIGQ